MQLLRQENTTLWAVWLGGHAQKYVAGLTPCIPTVLTLRYSGRQSRP